ncbi:MAG: radical SAM family heme chaperone HemW [Pirellulales bacterium]
MHTQADPSTNLQNTARESAPRAAYIHVPFCRHRCGYCNFTLVAGRDDLIEDYLRAIELELAALGVPREVDTLYFGGGTPTHLSTAQFRRLAETVLRWHPLASNHEWTVEANPADVTDLMIDTLRGLGVTRLSLGGQSFRAEKLRLLERDHDGNDIRRAVDASRDALMQVALDLIFAAPGETFEEWLGDLGSALALAPDHVSTYGLTFERGTTFWSRREHGELVSADEELERAMYAAAIDRLTVGGFEHYEVSNFAQPGRHSRHNEVYWSGKGYYAAGPGAARYVDGVRETNHRSVTTWLQRVLAGQSPVAEREQLDPESRAREQLVFSLRRLEGISMKAFRERTGYGVDELAGQALEKYIALGLFSNESGRLKLTREGLFVSDAIWPELL